MEPETTQNDSGVLQLTLPSGLLVRYKSKLKGKELKQFMEASDPNTPKMEATDLLIATIVIDINGQAVHTENIEQLTDDMDADDYSELINLANSMSFLSRLKPSSSQTQP